MPPLLQTLTQLVVVGLTVVSNVQALPACDSAAANVPLRLMPLGASITAGLHSSTGNGYRKFLRDMLVRDGFNIDMVGSRHQGDMENNANEGWSGYRVTQIEEKAQESVPRLRPNVFTINAGTNDARQNFEVEQVGQRMDKLIEYLWSASPGSTVVLSSLIINLRHDTEANVLKVNQQYRDLAAQKAAQGKRIVFVDMDTAYGPKKTEMADGTHPGDAGYDDMAKIFFSGIKEAQAKGWIEASPKVEGCQQHKGQGQKPGPADSSSSSSFPAAKPTPIQPKPAPGSANKPSTSSSAAATSSDEPKKPNKGSQPDSSATSASSRLAEPTKSSTSAASSLSLDLFGSFVLIASGFALSLSQAL